MPVGFQAGRGSWTTPSTPSLLGFSHPGQPSPYPIVLQESQVLVTKTVRAPLADIHILALLHLLRASAEQADRRHENPPPAPGYRPVICLRRLLLPA
jgi:hypothetical protein